MNFVGMSFFECLLLFLFLRPAIRSVVFCKKIVKSLATDAAEVVVKLEFDLS